MLYVHYRLNTFSKMTVVFIKLSDGITLRMYCTVLLPNHCDGHSFALHLLFHVWQQTLQLLKAFIHYSRFCVTKEQVKLMITHRTNSIIGEPLLNKLIDIF